MKNDRIRRNGTGGEARKLRGTLEFASIDDHARLPWRFHERHIAVDGLTAFS